MTTNTPPSCDPVTTLTFEQALQELENIVQQLEQGSVDLEQSIKIYERGEVLKKHCEKLLSTAETKIETIRVSANGNAESAQ